MSHSRRRSITHEQQEWILLKIGDFVWLTFRP